MKNQFKNPLPGKSQPASGEQLAENAQPVTLDDQSQKKKITTTGLDLLKEEGGILKHPWQFGQRKAHDTPYPNGLAEVPTLKQPSFGKRLFQERHSEAPYVQGRQNRYSPKVYSGLAEQFSPAGSQNIVMRTPQEVHRPPVQPQPRPSMQVMPAAGGPAFNAFNRVAAPLPQVGGGGSASLAAPAHFGPGSSSLFPGAQWLDQGRNGGFVPPSGGGPGRGSGRRPKRRRKVPIWMRVVMVLLLVLIVGGCGGYWYYQANFSNAFSKILGQDVTRAPGEKDPNQGRTGDILSGPRINILLLGSDTDQKFAEGKYIAQTDIVVTIDPTSKTVGMLSIPRDFYVNVPRYGMHKLDEAYGLGGVDLSRQTIQQDFGIPINYYAWVGLDGFIKVINEVGGVDVDVLHPLVDDSYPDDVGANANNPYALKRLYLAPGPQHLDGETALEYVRSRHADLVGDFGRSARQQQVLTALKAKLDNPDIFSKLPNIANALSGYLKTEMQLSDILKLMNFARSLDPNKINKLILGPPYSSSGQIPGGADVVFPNCDKIVPAINQMFDLKGAAVCNIQANSGSASSALASSTNQNAPLASTSANSATVTSLNTSASSAATLMTGAGNDLFGVRDLLDLMLMATFESPDGMQL